MITRRAWEAFGYRIGYRSSTDDLNEVLTQVILPDWNEVDPDTSQAWVEVEDGRIFDNGIYWTTAPDREQLALRLQQLTQMKLTWSAEKVLFLHSGVVRIEDRAWLFPGDSKAGKSTLIKAMCLSGAAFYSDEYAVIDEAGLTHSYPRPLWTRTTRKRRESTDPLTLGWSHKLGPIPVGRVYFCSYRKSSEWNPIRLSAEEAAAEASLYLRCAPKRRESAGRWLERAFQSASCWKGYRGEAEAFISSMWE